MMAGDDGDDNNAGDGEKVGEVGTYIKSYIVAIFDDLSYVSLLYIFTQIFNNRLKKLFWRSWRSPSEQLNSNIWIQMFHQIMKTSNIFYLIGNT